jgi:hypothetical protein
MAKACRAGMAGEGLGAGGRGKKYFSGRAAKQLFPTLSGKQRNPESLAMLSFRGYLSKIGCKSQDIII